jgi:hypothetical protein
MLDDRESIVPLVPIRHADGIACTERGVRTLVLRPERVMVLRSRVREGYYASASMMDAVARRILAVGDL